VARKAGSMLKKRFFKPDSYRSYQHPRYWTRFLFWWPNVLTSLDSLSRIGFRFDDPEIKVGLDWFRDNQQPSGLWKVSYEDKAHLGNARNMERSLWVTLNICRLFKRFNGSTAAEAS
jgi:hypothetical protein